ncbi:hypothetical protein [Ruegeria sp. ANG-R]|uniref:hypothetical protein n=1 Tax=Ruegeria sp. ANG-R TaxID=1577903 RepID=UPI00068E47E2|nr:hypothetical protein [Ruegeria sp. ANG-R]
MTRDIHSGGHLIAAILLAGAASIASWDFWAGTLSPLITGITLNPDDLIRAVFGIKSVPILNGIHMTTGIIAYPIGYAFFARPIARTITPFLPWWIVGIGFGMGLFVFGFYVMAHLVAGMPAFMGWSKLTYASLFGHILFGLTTVAVFRVFGYGTTKN